MTLLWSLAQPGTPGNHSWLRRFETPEITREVTFGQRFRMNRDSLRAIEFHPAEGGPFASGEIHFALVDITRENEPQVVRTGRVPWTALANRSSYRWDFEPVTDSKHKSYRFEIAAAAARSGVALVASRGVNRYPDEALTVNGRNRWVALLFQTYSSNRSTFKALWRGRTMSGVTGRLVLALVVVNWLLIGVVLRMVAGAIPPPSPPAPQPQAR